MIPVTVFSTKENRPEILLLDRAQKIITFGLLLECWTVTRLFTLCDIEKWLRSWTQHEITDHIRPISSETDNEVYTLLPYYFWKLLEPSKTCRASWQRIHRTGHIILDQPYLLTFSGCVRSFHRLGVGEAIVVGEQAASCIIICFRPFVTSTQTHSGFGMCGSGQISKIVSLSLSLWTVRSMKQHKCFFTYPRPAGNLAWEQTPSFRELLKPSINLSSSRNLKERLTG
jgi:hypothetical protein